LRPQRFPRLKILQGEGLRVQHGQEALAAVEEARVVEPSRPFKSEPSRFALPDLDRLTSELHCGHRHLLAVRAKQHRGRVAGVPAAFGTSPQRLAGFPVDHAQVKDAFLFAGDAVSSGIEGHGQRTECIVTL